MGPRGPAVVCVPARDEVERLPRLIRSLAEQDSRAEQEGAAAGDGAGLRVVVVANNCLDGTAEALRAMEAAGETAGLRLRLVEVRLAGAEAHVGTARRLALDAGADWLEAEGAPGGALLTTDADARVPPDWVAANLRALDGAEIVGGRLVIDADGPPDPALRDPALRDPALLDLHERIERYWAAVRAIEDRLDAPPHDPAPRHGDHTGASLALRADLYRRVGGLPPLPSGEDNALVARVEAQGGRLRHCPAVRVHVSDRRAGRADGGMAREMARRAGVAGGRDAYRLPAPAHWHGVITRRAALRRAWREGPEAAERALAALGLGEAERAAIAGPTCPNDVAFVARAGQRLDAVAVAPALADLDAALAGLDDLLRGPGPA